MNDRKTAGRLGFIKDSEGTYRKGNFIFKNGKIMRESQIVPKGTIQDLKDDYVTLDECIRSILAYSTTIGDVNPRATNVYIDKVGENYKPSKSLSKNTVAVVMSNRQVMELKPRDIIEQTDSKELANKDAKDKPQKPKPIKDFGKLKKESSKGGKKMFGEVNKNLKEAEKKRVFTVTIEETVDQDFEVEAVDGEEAMEIAEEKYNNGEFVLEPGNVTARLMAITGPEDEVTNFVEF